MELEMRIALLSIGVITIALLYFFGKSKHAKNKLEDEEFNFANKDLPDPLEIDQVLELDKDLESDYDNNDVSGTLGNELSKLVREDIAESPRASISKEKPSFKFQPSLLDDDPEPPKVEEKLVVLHVMARRPQKFSGKGIESLTKELDLELDEMQIFNKYVDRFSGKKSLYRMVNLVKPGTFDKELINEFETPGLSFVLHLPGPEEGLRAFNIMLSDAKRFAERLNGDLFDESHSRLSPQMTAHLQEDIQLFSLKNPRAVQV
jgi:cell division protein ZipA